MGAQCWCGRRQITSHDATVTNLDLSYAAPVSGSERRRASAPVYEPIEGALRAHTLGGGSRPRLELHSRRIRLMTEEASPPAYRVRRLSIVATACGSGK
jgi:hypothetical protein